MIRFTTTVGEKADHPDIAISINSQSELSPQWLLKYFEDEIHAGHKFKSEETVQIGWMLVQLRLEKDGSLEVWEPEFDSIPIRWCRGANNTLRHLILQRSVCDVLACEPEFPSLRQAGLVSSGFDGSQEFIMARETCNANDSGWVFRNLKQSGTEGSFESLFQISFSWMEVIPFLALPSGATVKKRVDSIEVCLGSTCISSLNNDLLNRLLKSPILV